MVHLVVARACVGVEPKPGGARLGQGDEEGRVPVEVDPAVGVVDQGVDHIQEEEGQVVGVPVEAGQTDQGRGLEEEACHHGLVGHQAVGGDPGRVVEDQAGRVDQGEDEEGPAFLLKQKTWTKHFEANLCKMMPILEIFTFKRLNTRTLPLSHADKHSPTHV